MTEPRPDVAVHLYEPGAGGLDRVAVLLANGFATRGLTTEIWLTKTEGASRHLLSESVRIRVMPGVKGPRGLALASQIPALRRLARTVRPRVLLSAGNQSNLPIALACRGTETAAVAKITNPIIRPGQQGLNARWRMARFRAVMRWSAAMVSLGAGEVAMLRDRWPEAGEKLVYLPLPAVTPAMAAVGEARRHAPPRAPDAPVQLLSIGRLAEQKDPETMLRAVALLDGIDWRLTMLGDGPLRAAMETLAAELGMTTRVHFAGFVADPTAYLAKADLFLLSSRWEGLCAVAMEALASGCRIVATDCSPSLTDLLLAAGAPAPVPLQDPAALAQAITKAIAQPAKIDGLIAAAAPYGLDAAIDAHIRLFARLRAPAQG